MKRNYSTNTETEAKFKKLKAITGASKSELIRRGAVVLLNRWQRKTKKK